MPKNKNLKHMFFLYCAIIMLSCNSRKDEEIKGLKKERKNFISLTGKVNGLTVPDFDKIENEFSSINGDIEVFKLDVDSNELVSFLIPKRFKDENLTTFSNDLFQKGNVLTITLADEKKACEVIYNDIALIPSQKLTALKIYYFPITKIGKDSIHIVCNKNSRKYYFSVVNTLDLNNDSLIQEYYKSTIFNGLPNEVKEVLK